MQIRLASVIVDDQDKALRFYTDVLGLKKKVDMQMGPLRWLTLSAPEGAEGVELVLEPAEFPAKKAYQKAMYDAGFPAFAFMTNDVFAEARRIRDLGADVRGEPANMGPITSVMFDDTCGNLIHLVQSNA